MSAPRPGLGRGIGALIPMRDDDRDPLEHRMRPVDEFFRDSSGPASVDDLLSVPGARLASLRIADIVPNAQQPRHDFDQAAMDELVHSVREYGVLQPIVVRPIGVGRYELVMGERRWRASGLAGRATIPAVIRDTADEQMLQDALLENLHRAQLNAIEEASAYQQLIADFGITHQQLGERLGRSRPMITNTLRLLNLPEHIALKVAAGVISAGHARAVLSVVKPELMDQLVDKIVDEDLNVRQSEAAAIRLAGSAKAKKSTGRRNEHLDEIADRLGGRFDTRVRVNLNASHGQIIIDFASVGDLNRILGEFGEPAWEEGARREAMLAARRKA